MIMIDTSIYANIVEFTDEYNDHWQYDQTTGEVTRYQPHSESWWPVAWIQTGLATPEQVYDLI